MSKKKITISEISEITHVSPATISRVLNHPELVHQSTIDKVHKAMEQLGYITSASSNAQYNQTPLVMAIIPDISNSFYNEIFDSLAKAARTNGFELLIHEAQLNNNSIDGFLNLIRQLNISGIILLNNTSSIIVNRIQECIPVVQCLNQNPDSNIPYITIDDYKAAHMAVDYLISRGCTKFSMVNGSPSCNFTHERYRGFMDALNEAELSVQLPWVINLPSINYEMAYAAAYRLLSGDVKPDSFFTSSDIFASAVVKAAKSLGLRVPEDIKVVGFDNIELSRLTSPSITTINQPKSGIGFAAFEMLVQLIEHPDTEINSIILDPELIIRETT